MEVPVGCSTGEVKTTGNFKTGNQSWEVRGDGVVLPSWGKLLACISCLSCKSTLVLINKQKRNGADPIYQGGGSCW